MIIWDEGKIKVSVSKSCISSCNLWKFRIFLLILFVATVLAFSLSPFVSSHFYSNFTKSPNLISSEGQVRAAHPPEVFEFICCGAFENIRKKYCYPLLIFPGTQRALTNMFSDQIIPFWLAELAASQKEWRQHRPSSSSSCVRTKPWIKHPQNHHPCERTTDGQPQFRISLEFLWSI